MSTFNKKLIKNLNEKEYIYLSELGKGTFGKIEKWFLQDNIYAIKEIYTSDTLERNKNVINYVNKNIKNFNYVLFYKVEQYKNFYYYISPVLSYDFFDYFIYYNNSPNLNQLLDIVHQLFLGINHLHDIGIIHGDLKMENIFIDKDTFQIKIADYDGSGLIPENIKVSMSTRGIIPINVKKVRKLKQIDDIYSLAIIIISIFIDYNDKGPDYYYYNKIYNKKTRKLKLNIDNNDVIWEGYIKKVFNRNYTKKLFKKKLEKKKLIINLLSNMIKLDRNKRLKSKELLEYIPL